MRRAGHDAANILERCEDVHAVAGDLIFHDVFIMHGASHFDDGNPSAHLSASFNIPEQDDGVGKGGNMRLSNGFAAEQRGRRVGEYSGDLQLFGMAGQGDDEFPEGLDGNHALHSRERVYGNTIRLKARNLFFDAQQMFLRSAGLRIFTDDPEQAFFLHALEI